MVHSVSSATSRTGITPRLHWFHRSPVIFGSRNWESSPLWRGHRRDAILLPMVVIIAARRVFSVATIVTVVVVVGFRLHLTRARLARRLSLSHRRLRGVAHSLLSSRSSLVGSPLKERWAVLTRTHSSSMHARTRTRTQPPSLLLLPASLHPTGEKGALLYRWYFGFGSARPAAVLGVEF